ncbi:MAG: rod shape-determining protein MreD [Candidatus Omnitrophota bacterium]|jgi:rod shape-determining protein MreD|nr:MAG: rod shape-determining protein MreD [Candidatus Omnitrophota bacterium]
MRYLAFIFFILVVFVIQVTILNLVKIFNVKPDLLLAVSVIATFYFDNKAAVMFAALAGFLKDVLSANPIGANILIFALCIYMVEQLLKRIFIDNDYSRMALMGLVVLVNGLLLKPVLLFMNHPVPVGIYSRILFIDIIYTALVFPLIFRAAEIFFRSRD